MNYNQDTINEAYLIAKRFIKKNGFKKHDLRDRLFLGKVPEDLIEKVIEDFELEEKIVIKKKAKKHLIYGVLLLIISVLITIVSYYYTAGVSLLFTGFTAVPALAFTISGAWDLIQK